MSRITAEESKINPGTDIYRNTTSLREASRMMIRRLAASLRDDVGIYPDIDSNEVYDDKKSLTGVDHGYGESQSSKRVSKGSTLSTQKLNTRSKASPVKQKSISIKPRTSPVKLRLNSNKKSHHSDLKPNPINHNFKLANPLDQDDQFYKDLQDFRALHLQKHLFKDQIKIFSNRSNNTPVDVPQTKNNLPGPLSNPIEALDQDLDGDFQTCNKYIITPSLNVNYHSPSQDLQIVIPRGTFLPPTTLVKHKRGFKAKVDRMFIGDELIRGYEGRRKPGVGVSLVNDCVWSLRRRLGSK